MNNQTFKFEIKTINRVLTDKMRDADMSARYQLGIVGDFPRTDRAGSQCTVSIPEATLAIHLESIMAMPSSNNYMEAVALMREEPHHLQQFIGGLIEGVVFQEKGSTYKLSEFSQEVKAGTAKVGDVAIVKENRFSLIYNGLRMTANMDTVSMNVRAKEQARIYEKAQRNNVFANVFGQSKPQAIDASPEQPQDATIVEWFSDLDSMVAYAKENELDIKALVKPDGSLKNGKTEAGLKATIEALM